jgi:hypothetical protein
MTRENQRKWSSTATYAVAVGPRAPIRRGSSRASTIPQLSAESSAMLAARWERPSASRTSRSVKGCPRAIR